VISRQEQDMRGSDIQTAGLFSYVSCEARVPTGHPLRPIRAIVDEALEVLSPDFEAMYSAVGRLWFLPPYSPDLNPIEQAFSKIKHWMRRVRPRPEQRHFE
jgi:hypothetical protein